MTTTEITHVLTTLGAKHADSRPSIGEVQKFFKAKFPGQYEGKRVSELYKEIYG